MNRETSPSTLAVKFSCKIMVEVIERHIELSYNICIRGTFVIYAVASCMIRSNTARKKNQVWLKVKVLLALLLLSTFY